MSTIAVVAESSIATKNTFELVFGALSIAAILAILLVVVWLFLRNIRSKAKQMEYTSLRSYLQAIPRNDFEKLDAVELAVKGVALCLLGLLFPPLVILGLVPLFYGCRKVGSIVVGIRPPGADDTPVDQSGSSR
jgi:hypothetical protein